MSLILIQDLDTPTRFPGLTTEVFFQKQCVCIGPILAGLSHTDFYCPQLPIKEKCNLFKN